MSGKSGHRVTGSKPAGSTRTSAKTDGAFGKEGVDQLVSETDRNRDKATTHGQKSDGGEDREGFHQGASRKKTVEAEALHCPTCGRRFETEEELTIHSPDCAGAKRSGSGETQTRSSVDEIAATHQFKSTP